ncbi:MAG: DUF503 domain-containing protein [Acidimicrobiia bacterium]|jgi:hypothetical protein
MHAAALLLELRLPDCSSLKEKRRRLRPLLDHLRRRMELSASEVGHHDAWQRTSIGVAVVAPQAGRLDEIVERIRRWALELDDVELVDIDIGHVEMS